MQRRTETVMTYEDWCKAHRRTLKKMAKDTISICMQWAAVGLITVGYLLVSDGKEQRLQITVQDCKSRVKENLLSSKNYTDQELSFIYKASEIRGNH